ncbi:MAG TPA: imidazoleglycerol-phosphate dehydratase HisB [Firmicutes bacterium]|nr:imidazoleglycerol-phosphate dehydratase HisB [Bacillota bacterium]
MERRAQIHRQTKETSIELSLNVDGTGQYHLQTGVGFFDHMLAALAKHGRFDLDLTVQGDLEVDAHHTVEDVGLCLGEAFRQALGDKANITRFGQACVPMDEALVLAAVDLCGRGFYYGDLQGLEGAQLGTMDGQLVPEFFQSLAYRGGITLHVRVLAGGNWHHMAEAAFKAVAVALRQACSRDQSAGIPSTKGTLD